MKRLNALVILVLLAFQLLFQQCARETTQIIIPNTLGDTDTPDDLNEWIEQQPVANLPLNKMLLPNGRSIENFQKEYAAKYKGGRIAEDYNPEDQKNMVIASMGEVAQRLCNRENFQYAIDAPDGPAQNGLAYSWGQSNYKKRELPPSSPDCSGDVPCPFRIYGLDCSGFITNLLREATDPSAKALLFTSINRENSTTQGTEKFWNDLLKQNKKFDKVEIKKKGQLDAGSLKSGDIIHWPGHIGYVFESGGKLYIYQSNGKSSDSTRAKYSKAEVKGKIVDTSQACKDKSCDCKVIGKGECEKNYSSSSRGVRAFEATQDEIKIFGKSYEILRFTTKLGGKWKLQLKCDWAANDNVAVTFDITLPDTQDDKPFTANGTGKDYDGSNLYVTFEGTYDAYNRKLKGRLTTKESPTDPTPPRIDDFTYTLPDDAGATEWINLQSVYKDSDSCAGQIKLERISTDTGKRLPAAKLTKQNFL
ncbi:hypothetical protein [Runella sp.]|uniref:hypothetical protein n=1 Tax=Runella sp. TaxID=1960881 RepID=UPI0030193BB8